MRAASGGWTAGLLAAALGLLCTECGDQRVAPDAAQSAQVAQTPADIEALDREEFPVALRPPLPEWPKDRFPSDLEVVTTITNYRLRYKVVLRADGADAGVLSSETTKPSRRTCRFALDREGLARFGWNDFIETIESGKEYRPPRRDCRAEDGCASTRTSMTAFGQAFDWQTVALLGIGPEVQKRVAEMVAYESRKHPESCVVHAQDRPLILNPYRHQ